MAQEIKEPYLRYGDPLIQEICGLCEYVGDEASQWLGERFFASLAGGSVPQYNALEESTEPIHHCAFGRSFLMY